MKATGIVRKVDELGRVVLPIELRNGLNIEPKDPIEFYVSADKIVLKKYQPADIFTGETQDLIEYNGKKISKKSIRELAALAGFTITEETKAASDDDLDLDDIDEDL
ncbi:MAG: AbrB/MazE/SpoVT family DNA-binding domain-containing protein [Firmicutes bacterium]|nr:AbrB/MazE/SpoVT family DNA-binding domain-containing protein [Bacillota bacterium]